MHKITNVRKIPINRVSDSFYCCQMHLQVLVVSEQRYILNRGMRLLMKQIAGYKTYETDL